MSIPGKRRLWLFVGVVVLVLVLVGVTTVIIIKRHYKEIKVTQSTTGTGDARFQQALDRTDPKSNPTNTSAKQAYDKAKGITTTSDFEKKYASADREAGVILVLTNLVTTKNFTAALNFVNYIEAHYPKVAQTVNFDTLAYITAKNLNKADLMANYKQKTETLLRTQGTLKSDQSLPDSYFNQGSKN